MKTIATINVTHYIVDAVINILTEYNLLTVNRNPDCFNDDARSL